jgi:hypothetical protein
MRWFEIEMRRGRLVAVALVARYRLGGDFCSPNAYMLRGRHKSIRPQNPTCEKIQGRYNKRYNYLFTFRT